MEVSVRVVCLPDVAGGFELAGMMVDAAAHDDVGDVLRRVLADPKVGVVLLDERLHHALPGELARRLEHAAPPVLVLVPPPAWEGRTAAEDYVLEILRQAVGYRVELR